MSKIQEKIQGEFDDYIFKCYCGENSYLQVTQDPDDRELYISITLKPTRLSERLELAWKSLRGMEFYATDEVIILGEDSDKLIEALTLSQGEIK